MYGYANLGDDEMAEFGYINLSELQNLKLPLGLTIERDLYMPKDIDITEAIERNGFEVPSYLYKTEEDKEQNIEI